MLGPTAAGKSEVALRLAEDLSAEIVSVDSMQVYRRMDIGTAKPTVEERELVRHHGIDLVDPSETFNVSEFQRIGRAAIEKANGPIVIAGGSGLHFRALVDPMEFRPHDREVRDALEDLPPEEAVRRLLIIDPEAPAHMDVANPRRVTRALEIAELTGETPTFRANSAESKALAEYRPRIEFRSVGFDPGDGLANRVQSRFHAMVAAGLLAEVASLANDLGRTAAQAVGYKELLPVVAGASSLDAGIEAATRATLGLAKRQRTFFRRDPRVVWLPWNDRVDERYRSAVTALRR